MLVVGISAVRESCPRGGVSLGQRGLISFAHQLGLVDESLRSNVRIIFRGSGRPLEGQYLLI